MLKNNWVIIRSIFSCIVCIEAEGRNGDSFVSVGSVTGARIPLATISSSFSLIWSLKATGTRRGGCTTGGTVSSVTMWYSPGRSPKPPKTSLYSPRRSAISTVTPTLGVFLIPLEVEGLSQSLIVMSPSSIHVWYDNSGARSSSVMLNCKTLLFPCCHLGSAVDLNILYRFYELV